MLSLADAFFNWRVYHDDALWLGVWSPGREQYGCYRYLPFGMKTSPALNDESVKDVLRLLDLREEVTLTDFVDEFLGSKPTKEDAWAVFRSAVRFFLKAGVPGTTKQTGLKPPAQKQVWVGRVFDTVKTSLPVERTKSDMCIVAAEQVLASDSAGCLRARELASAAGLASHIAQVFLQGRRRLDHVWSALNSADICALWAKSPPSLPASQSVGRCAVGPALVDACSHRHSRASSAFRCLLPSLRGPTSPEFASWRSLAAAGSIRAVETDASRLHGWSYHPCDSGRGVSGEWPAHFSTFAENATRINYKELFVALQLVRTEAD